MLRSLLVALAVTFAAGLAVAADETYTIKVYKDKKGDKTVHDTSETEKKNIAVTGTAKDSDQDVVSGKKEDYVEEVLEVAEGERKPTKLTRTYGASEKSVQGATTKNAYAGKTVLIEKKGKTYEFSIDGTALTKAEAPDLFQKFNKSDDEPKDEDLMPTEPLAVGGTWKVPADKAEKMFKTIGDEKMKVDAKKSTIQGKLLKAYKKDGTQFGIVELTVKVVIAEIDLGGGLSKATGGFTMKATGDICIDGTSMVQDMKKEHTIDLGVELPGGGKFKITGTTSKTDKVRPVSKK